MRTYIDKAFTNFRVLNVPEDYEECESFTVIYIYSLLFYENKYYLQEYLDNCAHKISNKQMPDYFKTDEDLVL